MMWLFESRPPTSWVLLFPQAMIRVKDVSRTTWAIFATHPGPGPQAREITGLSRTTPIWGQVRVNDRCSPCLQVGRATREAMQTRFLGETGVAVSKLTLGT